MGERHGGGEVLWKIILVYFIINLENENNSKVLENKNKTKLQSKTKKTHILLSDKGHGRNQ